MYHSIIFRVGDQGRDTWDDWHLIPTSRPVFNPPRRKSTLTNIPGMDGILDSSDILRKYPVYENREGSFEFIVENGYGSWNERYSAISNFLHGRNARAFLEDDVGYFYEGVFTLNEWRSEPNWSKIVIGYSVSPYKLSITSSTEDWLWDPFNFETGVIQKSIFKNIRVDTDIWQKDDGSYTTSQWEYTKLPPNAIGRKPVIPIITVHSDDGNGLLISIFSNNITQTYTGHVHLPDGTGKYIGTTLTDSTGPNDIDFSRSLTSLLNITKNSTLNELLKIDIAQQPFTRIALAGHGAISFDFRSGSL